MTAVVRASSRYPKQFFIVFSPEGLTPPTVVHSTHPGAMFAAAQMAKYNPESSFFVMGSMSARVIPRASAGEAGTATDSAAGVAEGEHAVAESETPQPPLQSEGKYPVNGCLDGK